jgi:hypothetical protein
MRSQVTEQGNERGVRARSTARTSWPASSKFGIDSSVFGDLGDVNLGVSVDSLRCCRIGSSAAGDCISGRPSRANDIILFELPRQHRLVGSGAGAAGSRGGERDRGSRRHGSVRGRPRGSAAAGRANARSAGRRRQGRRAAPIGWQAAAGGRSRCCAGVRPRAMLAPGRAGSTSTQWPVRVYVVSLCLSSR